MTQHDQPKWLPIETAPKDGSLIIVSMVWTSSDGKHRHRIERPIIVRWIKPSPETATFKTQDKIITVKRLNPRWCVDDHSWREPLTEKYEPTHWMPIPKIGDE